MKAERWQVAKHCPNHYTSIMSTVAEIEKPLKILPVEEAKKVAGLLLRYLGG
jgi:hypothetical protein